MLPKIVDAPDMPTLNLLLLTAILYIHYSLSFAIRTSKAAVKVKKGDYRHHKIWNTWIPHRDLHDINNNIQSPIWLFADDSIIYRKIKSEADNNILLSDLIQLQLCSNKWQMEFSIPKFVHLPITNQTKPGLHSYSLCGVPLYTVSSHPYIDTKLTWANHITDIASKSSKVLCMIKRTLGPCKPDVKDASPTKT